jgi:hypothetical protein
MLLPETARENDQLTPISNFTEISQICNGLDKHKEFSWVRYAAKTESRVVDLIYY